MYSAFKDFPELAELYACAESVSTVGEVREEAWVRYKYHDFPILSFRFGSTNPSAPTLLFVAGVHGLEKIGTHVVSSFLKSFIRLVQWDRSLINVLGECRILFYPLVNPVGMFLNSRSNGRGIDLMRNAPLDAEDRTLPLVGGHRIGNWLPWYRGEIEQAMEHETITLCDFVRKQVFPAETSLILDVHSGFGLIDRVWFPYAYSHRYYPHAPRILALKKLLDQSYPHHVYVIEPQHHAYTTHGDIWDYLSLEQQSLAKPGVMLPLSLEMGSWHWVKKNPRQIFSSLGIFNPVLPHRVKRTERRHFFLFDFLIKAIASGDRWADIQGKRQNFLEKKARQLWYQKTR
ncbi:MAG: M14 family zinc carboxypeptidase [Proteobacteria bacterium]|nr:M14 family zinc carboxypeptidase [Pseudomonadota bacterium]